MTYMEPDDKTKQQLLDELEIYQQRQAELETLLARYEKEDAMYQMSVAHLQHTPLAMLAWDTDFKAIEWNPAAEKIFGYTREEALGKHFAELIVPEDLHVLVNNIFHDLMAGRGGTRSTNENNTKDGRRILCEWYNTLLEDRTGQVYGMATLAQDVTERLMYREKLETAVAERTKELIKINHELKNEMAVRVRAEQQIDMQKHRMRRIAGMNSMGALASSLAHELNQPLAIISSYAQECAQRIQSADGDISTIIKPMKKIESHANRAGEILHRIRGFFSAGQLQKSQGNLNSVINKAVDYMRQESRTEGEITLSLFRPAPDLLFDEVQIEQVILNIVQNGLDAMQAAGSEQPEVCIETRIEGDVFVVNIFDNGPGLEEEVAENIFEPFFTTKTEGMGMGLAICHSIIEAHGGQLSVSNRQGCAGANFQFTLPISIEQRGHYDRSRNETNSVCG